MSASLVGSEMCIRDSSCTMWATPSHMRAGVVPVVPRLPLLLGFARPGSSLALCGPTCPPRLTSQGLCMATVWLAASVSLRGSLVRRARGPCL
eukprot:7000771-Alexandrium_andersonii.AAC.1